MIVASCTTNFYSTCVRPYVTLVVFQTEIFCPYNPIRPNIQNSLVKANFPLQNFVAAGPLYGFPSCSRIRRRNSHHDFAVEGARDGGQGDEPRHELHRDGGQGARRHQRRPVGPLRPTDAGGGQLHVHLRAGMQFNRKTIGLSFGLKNGLRFRFDSETCLNYPFLNIFLV